MTRRAFALTSAALLVSVSAGCHQSSATGSEAAADLKIVGLTQIDRSGAQVQASSGVEPVNPAGDGRASCPPVSLAAALPLTGSDAALGANIKNGTQLAVDQHNAANAGCQVQLKAFDTEGDPQRATAIAPQIIDDPSVIGLIGPGNSGEVKATGDVFEQVGLVAATPSATNVTLSQNGWKTFIRGLANDDVQGPSVANYLKIGMAGKKVCVIDDSTYYGSALPRPYVKPSAPWRT